MFKITPLVEHAIFYSNLGRIIGYEFIHTQMIARKSRDQKMIIKINMKLTNICLTPDHFFLVIPGPTSLKN